MPYKCKDKQRKFQREWVRIKKNRLRGHIVALLGAKCAICEEAEYSKLDIDHIIPIRRPRDYRRFSTSAETVKSVLKGATKLEELQLLCKTCHMAKTVKERKAG